MSRSIPTRSQVPQNETWDLSDFFPSFDAWDADFNSLPSEAEVRDAVDNRFRGRLATSPQTLFEALQYQDALSRRMMRLFVYARLSLDVDVANTAVAERLARFEGVAAAIESQFAFLNPEILKIPGLESWLGQEPLATYAFPLSELLRNRDHVLSEAEEAVLTRLQLPLSKFSETYSKWKNVDLQFASARDSAGHEHVVSNSRYGQLLQHPDRTLRQSTFESYFTSYRQWRNTIASNFYGKLQTGSTVARIRRFSSFREQELFQDAIPLSVYDGLVDAVRANLPTFHRSVALRRKVLGLDKVCHWDRSVSIAEGGETRYSWDEAVRLILESLEPMGPEYIEIARRGLTTDRWVDYAENKGKRAGAYSFGCYDSKPFILMSWTSSLRDVFTLAHELGHSMHSWFSRKSQPYHLSQYTIFVAEVASTFHEIMLANHILRTQPHSPLARSIVAERIQGFEGTVLRQTLFATFEREAARLADEGEAVTADALDEIFGKLCLEWFGPDYEMHPMVAAEWMTVPHFYTTFYVYKYATSQCASEALSERMLHDMPGTRERMMRFLKAGGSKQPLATMLDAGIDFLTPEPVANAFASYARMLDTAQTLFGR